jgi:hypothetical protein
MHYTDIAQHSTRQEHNNIIFISWDWTRHNFGASRPELGTILQLALQPLQKLMHCTTADDGSTISHPAGQGHELSRIVIVIAIITPKFHSTRQ